MASDLVIVMARVTPSRADYVRQLAKRTGLTMSKVIEALIADARLRDDVIGERIMVARGLDNVNEAGSELAAPAIPGYAELAAEWSGRLDRLCDNLARQGFGVQRDGFNVRITTPAEKG